MMMMMKKKKKKKKNKKKKKKKKKKIGSMVCTCTFSSIFPILPPVQSQEGKWRGNAFPALRASIVPSAAPLKGC
jgi:hypothetical protein